MLSLLAHLQLLAFASTLDVSTAAPRPEDALPRRGALGLAVESLFKKESEKLGLAGGQGVRAKEPVPGLTAHALGVRAGDLLLELDDEPVSAATLAGMVRGKPAGARIALDVVRDGEAKRLEGVLLEKPRDAGTDLYSVEYSHVTHAGQRMRTIVTRPRKPGKHPGFLFIQGFSPLSYDYVLSTSTGDVSTIDGPLLHAVASAGFVTLRVEKPGVGDSEGGPFAELDYHSEIGIYAEGLRQLKSLPEVDPNDVFLFGHSMGGSFGPMIAADDPVRGIAVYGAAARTWFEYILDTLRYQGLVAGESFENADEKARKGAQLMALVMLEKQSPAEVEKSHPELAPFSKALFPGGLFNGKTLDFWCQLQEVNFPSYWSRLDCHVLSVKGASDFVVYEADHKLIADVVNKKRPGRGKFVIAPNSDHLLHAFATEQDSVRAFQKGQYSDSFAKLLLEWMAEVRKQ